MEEFEDAIASGEVVVIIPNTTARMTRCKPAEADKMPDCVIVVRNILQALSQESSDEHDDVVCGCCRRVGPSCALCGDSMDLCCHSLELWAQWEAETNVDEHFGPFDARNLSNKHVTTRASPDTLCILCHQWLTFWSAK